MAAAAFRRGNVLWLVFDTEAPLDPTPLQKGRGEMVTQVVAEAHPGARVFRLHLAAPWPMAFSQEGHKWKLALGEMVRPASAALVVSREKAESQGPRVSVAVKPAGRIHWVEDPDIGDRLGILTLFGPVRSVKKPYRFAEFVFLPTAHGLALVPFADDLTMRVVLDRLRVERPGGLALSLRGAEAEAPRAQPSARARKASGRRRRSQAAFLDFRFWRRGGPKRFWRKLGILERAAAVARRQERRRIHLKMAHLYLANNMHAEALGILRLMAKTDPTVKRRLDYAVTRGVANVLLRRWREARKDLSKPALANDPDAALWRGLAFVGERAWEKALKAFRQGQPRISDYLPEHQALFRLAAARAALEARRLPRAAEELDGLPTHGILPAQRAEAYLLRGWYLEGLGQKAEAEEAYENAIDSGYRPVMAEARERLTALRVASGEMTVAQAIDDLERQQFLWRGDDVELKILRQLARLYARQRQYHKAFQIMETAVKTYPDAPLALKTQDEMKALFKDLFLYGKAAALPPVKALGLYYDYRELTPIGREGDEMIRRLAERLVSVDLLDQAAALLRYQVNKRLKGVARAQVAARLAMIHLMNRKPELALRVLQRTRLAKLPSRIQKQRNLLEARALAELGRAESAIEILGNMSEPAAERIKADALWNARKWNRAGEQYERMLGDLWRKTTPLSPEARLDVLRAAISYALAGDQFGIDRIRQKYARLMAQTPDAEAFLVLTRPLGEKDGDFRRIAQQIAAIDTLEAFMKAFRKRYAAPPAPQATGALPEPQRPNPGPS